MRLRTALAIGIVALPTGSVGWTLGDPPAGAGPAGDAVAHWARFRGPDGQGVARPGHAYPAALDLEAGLRFRAPAPPGHASPCVHGDLVFLAAHEADARLVVALDRRTGEERWRAALPVEEAEEHHEIGGPASATPCADGERVYASFGELGLVAVDRAGEVAWTRPFGTPDNTFGSAASLVLAGGHLLHLRDTNGESFLEALDPATGDVRWRAERSGFGAGWSTPSVRRVEDRLELLVNGVGSLTAYDLADGAVRWASPGLTDEPIVTPAAGAGLVFVSSYNMKSNVDVEGLPTFAELVEELDQDGDGALDADEAEANESILSRHDADGEGDHPLSLFFRWMDRDRDGEVEAEEYATVLRWVDGFAHADGVLALRPGEVGAPPELVWQFERGVPECPSPLFYDGRLYIVKNGGLAAGLDAATGEVRFEGRVGARGPRYASPVAADGKVYAVSARGVLTVLAAGDELEVLSTLDLAERTMATPALALGDVLVRTEEALYAFRTAPDDAR